MSQPSSKRPFSLRLTVSGDLPITTFRWLDDVHQREQMLEAVTAFWSPFALQSQGIDPLWSKAQALSSISRLQQQIILIQQSFGIVAVPFDLTSVAVPHPESDAALKDHSAPPTEPEVAAPLPTAPKKLPIPSTPPILPPFSTASSPPVVHSDLDYAINIGGFDDFDAELESQEAA